MVKKKYYTAWTTLYIVRDVCMYVVQKYNTAKGAKGGGRVEKYIIARGGHRTRQERIIW